MSILHITVNTPTKQPYCTEIYSLVTGHCKTTSESIKPILDVKRFSVSSYCVFDHPYPQCAESVIFLSSSMHPR